MWRTVLVALALGSSACAPQGLSFRADERVTITSPDEREEVRLPVTLSWRADDLAAKSFAVFVDRAPVRPGKRVTPLDNRIYITDDTKIEIAQLEASVSGRRDRHRATIVVIDGTRRRVGESAWDVVFEVDRRAGT